MEPLFRHILVPIDGSEPSLEAVQMALRLIQLCPTCLLTAMYVVDKLILKELVHLSVRPESEVKAELEEEGRRYLDSVRNDAQRQSVSVQARTQQGDPFEEIIGAANELGVDLIIMGHTGRRGTARVLIGSVTQRVLDYSPCPVLVTKGGMTKI